MSPVLTQKKKHILDFSLEELERELIQQGEPGYRARQIFDWVYQKNVFNFLAMSNLPLVLRSHLEKSFLIFVGREITRRVSNDGTLKILLEFKNINKLRDKDEQSKKSARVETVLIPTPTRQTACLSTQFGCAIGCSFCATGQGPFFGNLSPGQIIEQALRLQAILKEHNQKLSHIVFMGMGEPLLNYEATIKVARFIHARWGMNISARRITISTVGLPEGINRLAEESLPFNLAISLHSPFQKKREAIIPVAAKYPLSSILEAAQNYFQKTGREITLEYLMLPGFNLSLDDAHQLAKLARQIRANVNLIPYNPTHHSDFRPPSPNEIKEFVKELRRWGVKAHVRQSRGGDIEAACGQLRQRASTQ